MTEERMNPDLYVCLPPDKKKEYKKLFHKPVNIEITRHIIDSCGNVWLFKDWEPLTIPEEWLSITKKMDELNYMDRIIQPRICIDNRIPEGYALFGGQFFALPDAQTRTSTELHKTRYLTSSEGYMKMFPKPVNGRTEGYYLRPPNDVPHSLEGGYYIEQFDDHPITESDRWVCGRWVGRREYPPFI